MILNEIVSHNIKGLELKKRSLPMAELLRMVLQQPPPSDLALTLRGNGIQLIAEVKKASPHYLTNRTLLDTAFLLLVE